jgi:hypothetical protein
MCVCVGVGVCVGVCVFVGDCWCVGEGAGGLGQILVTRSKFTGICLHKCVGMDCGKLPSYKKRTKNRLV